VEFLVCESF